MTYSIVTNNKPRPVLYGFMLTEKEKSDFDYIDNIDDATFFRYKGNLYDLGDIEAITKKERPELHDKGWQGIVTDSYFSGVLIKYPTDDYGHMDTDNVVVALILS